MEFCLYCGEEYDPTIDPYHEDECQDRFVSDTVMKIKTNPKLKKLLETILNEKREEKNS